MVKKLISFYLQLYYVNCWSMNIIKFILDASGHAINRYTISYLNPEVKQNCVRAELGCEFVWELLKQLVLVEISMLLTCEWKQTNLPPQKVDFTGAHLGLTLTSFGKAKKVKLGSSRISLLTN